MNVQTEVTAAERVVAIRDIAARYGVVPFNL
jgi:hypothetical protein